MFPKMNLQDLEYIALSKLFGKSIHIFGDLGYFGFYDFSVDLFCVAKIRRAGGTERDGQSLQRCCCLYLLFFL